MNTLTVILLAIIAYILWLIYHQHENEKRDIAIERSQIKLEQEKKDLEIKFPHLVGKIDGNWLKVFAPFAKDPGHLLKMAFHLMLGGSTIDYSEGSLKYDTLWDCSKELLEHLEKFHEGSITEHEVAVCTYWQIVAEATVELIKKSPKNHISKAGREWAPIEGEKLEVEPYTNIEKIALLFPKRSNHQVKEISFFNVDGSFPRESNGSTFIDEKISAIGL